MKKGKPLLIFFLLIWLVSQQPVTGVVDEKNSQSSTPCTTTPPPPHGGGGSGGVPSQAAPSSQVTTTAPPSPTLVPPPATPTTDPDPPPFTCDYWRRHPEAILALFGSWCTLGQFFGLPAAYALGRNPSLLEALSNTRADGIGALYREGTASFLNSLVSRSFVFTPRQVRDAFNAAVLSNSAAGAQAELFKKANEGHLVTHH
ncbi:hypothetical protein OPV22_015773 [Ensete ventricosum]|uniref:Uncharacterized protein n=1 Tax=Ensete ventricosum TaxID=4639 RepID=A0AAV8REG4_ENSVE|nr:hypothetical protein OPV22_015773 [Ensete ventricosum]